MSPATAVVQAQATTRPVARAGIRRRIGNSWDERGCRAIATSPTMPRKPHPAYRRERFSCPPRGAAATLNGMEILPPPRPRNRGIYLLPNLFTTGGLFAGFFAIIAASQGRFEAACVAIFVAAVLDGVDGRVARLTNTQSEFGVQYDSLADLVSFGMAPALVMYYWALSALKLDGVTPGKIGWLTAFL